MAPASCPRVCSSEDGGRGRKRIKLFGVWVESPMTSEGEETHGDGEPQIQDEEQVLLEQQGETEPHGEEQPHQLQQQGGGEDHSLQYDHYPQPHGAAYCTATHAFLSSQHALARNSATHWTVEEHRGFLRGLVEKGKGKWDVIAKEFVKTRTPLQVASHAQKYFLRLDKPHGRRRSIFDVPLVSEKISTGKAVRINYVGRAGRREAWFQSHELLPPLPGLELSLAPPSPAAPQPPPPPPSPSQPTPPAAKAAPLCSEGVYQ